MAQVSVMPVTIPYTVSAGLTTILLYLRACLVIYPSSDGGSWLLRLISMAVKDNLYMDILDHVI